MEKQNKKTTPISKQLLYFAALLLSVIHIANIWLIFPSNILRGVHLGFVVLLVYLPLIDNKAKAFSILNLVKALVAFFACIYYGFNFDELISRVTSPTVFDMAIGIALVIILIDATNRTVGKGMGIITCVFLLYAILGKYLPGLIGHAGFSVHRLVGHLYLSANGVFGSMIQISATYIAMFTLLGAFLEKCGASDAFINIAIKATGKMQGGPALAAVIASCLFGMVNGSAVVNVITTGTFTIPLMKSIGIAPHVAGAVEAAASTGGQIMPPVMGAGAFIMADITGVPYSSIIIKALIPALIYFIGVFSAVYFYVKKNKIPKVNEEQIPQWKTVYKNSYLLLPLVVVFIMIISNFSPVYSAVFGIIVSAMLIFTQTIKTPKKLFNNIGISLIEGGRSITSVAMGLACAGIIIGVVTLTGLGSKFVTFVIALSQGYPYVALIFVAIACLILGMGLPTSAAYVITATLAVPALVEMKLPLFACHLFVFYFAVIAPITPPVAIAAYAGAGIANADPNKTGWKAFVFALPAFLMPFLFVSEPLLLAEGNLLWVIWAFITAFIGTIALAASTQGYFMADISTAIRILLGIGALLLIIPGAVTDTIGLVIITGITVFILIKNKRSLKEGEVVH